MLNHKYIRLVFFLLFAIIIFIDWQWGIAWYYYVTLALGFGLLIFLGSYFIRLNYFTRSLNHGDRNLKQIALTFDDGPMNGHTQKVLDILREQQVSGLFFLIGRNIAGNEALLVQLEKEGHIMGNHSYSHNYWFSLKSKSEMLGDLQKFDDEIERVLGKRPKLFRPPYGVTNPMVADAIERGKYTSVGWSLRTYDTNATDRNKLFDKIMRKLRNGDVILFHDWGRFTADVLPDFIKAAKAKGFEFVRADKLLGVEAYY